MSDQVVFMFSGQGSHYYQMGRELYEHHPGFRKWMLMGDGLVSDLIGLSLLEQLYNDSLRKGDRFDRTLYTHPAIFLVEYALTRVVMDMGIEPTHVLDSSLGGFTAAAVAGVLSFEEALTAVVEQAKALETHCPPGGMMAILHPVHLYFDDPLLYEHLELAGINFPNHFVVSGRPEALSDIHGYLKNKKISLQLLPISHGFHSSLIDSAADTYQKFLDTLTLQRPKVAYISCSQANILPSIPQYYLWEVVREPVHFQKTIQLLENRASYTYLDLGPSGTLAAFVKYNLTPQSRSKSIPVLNPFGHDMKNLEVLKSIP
jgi:acyl transferase domain-containing protein